MTDPQPSPPAGLTAGRIVHYVLQTGNRYPGDVSRAGEHRPAIVVKVWEPMAAPYPVQLVVFLDGTNDTPSDELVIPRLTHWASSVQHDPTGTQPHTWHFPESV